MTTLTARVLPPLLSGRRAGRLMERNFLAARRHWILILSGFFEPVFYLFSIGVGFGTLVGSVTGPGGAEIGYPSFVAPALLAATAMNGAIYDSTFNIFWKLRYAKTYDAMLSTPLGPGDIAVGEITWAQLRGTAYSAGFVLLMVLMGLTSSWWTLLALPAAMLIGYAFGGAGMALTTWMRTWQDFEWVTLAIIPMFLFSATFVPTGEYPEAVQWILPLTPLYNGVELLRAFALGDVGLGILGHVAYLVAMVAVGLWFAASRLERQLLK